jgi:ThiF family
LDPLRQARGRVVRHHQQRQRSDLAVGLTADCSFSQKPGPDGYADYYDKFITYVNLVVGHAQAVQPGVTATTFRPVPDDEDSVFLYMDTASSRAGITALTDKLALPKVAIVGMGGTGAYLLDFLAKLPIRELHLYDADIFATHNAFRAPGAAPIEELREGRLKVDHHAGRYQPMRRGIHPHSVYVTAQNAEELLAMDFVFLAMDPSEHKKAIVGRLGSSPVPFVDTGIGILSEPGGLRGNARSSRRSGNLLRKAAPESHRPRRPAVLVLIDLANWPRAGQIDENWPS